MFRTAAVSFNASYVLSTSCDYLDGLFSRPDAVHLWFVYNCHPSQHIETSLLSTSPPVLAEPCIQAGDVKTPCAITFPIAWCASSEMSLVSLTPFTTMVAHS